MPSLEATFRHQEILEWLDGQERDQLKVWLEAHPPIEQTGPYTFKIGEREADFSSWLEVWPHHTLKTTLEEAMHKRVYEKKDGRMLYLYGLSPHTLPPLEEGENTGQAQSHAR